MITFAPAKRKNGDWMAREPSSSKDRSRLVRQIKRHVPRHIELTAASKQFEAKKQRIS